MDQKIDWIIGNIKDKVENRKIVALVSGGKDSMLSVALAKKASLNVVKLVNYTHRWTWKIYKSQLDDLSKEFGIPIEYVDVTEQLRKPVPDGLMGYVGIPCKHCKKEMFLSIYNKALREGASVVMSGYNLMDSVSSLIEEHLKINNRNEEWMEFNQFSKYISSDIIFELRPLIRLNDEEILQTLNFFGIKVKRTHEANPQFNYWREGCPMQYLDRDIPITEKLLDESVRINEKVTAYARENDFRASVLVPSHTIITFPESREMEIKKLIETL